MLDSGLCIGCGVCVGAKSGARMDFDRYGQMRPTGPRRWLNDRQEPGFEALCPFSPFAADEDALAARLFPSAHVGHALLGRYEAAYVGHAEEGAYRAAGSSGGLVTWVAAELLRRNMVDGVAHVGPLGGGEPGNRLFGYTLSRSPEAIRAGAKSRYYPVELSEVLGEIRGVPGRYAIVGIPCFIKAVRLACEQDPILQDRIVYTLGLVCGHMKSARMAESFAWQMGQDIGAATAFDYRVKAPDRPANWYRAELILTDGTRHGEDWWHFADGDWGAGFFQNSACNFCDDVVAETADIVFGDAWREPYSSDGRGTNVVLVRSPALLPIIEAGIAERRLALTEVDADFVISTQAAGFRQRREGLSFRQTFAPPRVRPRKRVKPGSYPLSAHRKAIYLMRYGISRWSHRVFFLARAARLPALYLAWARASLTCYHGLAYSRGLAGRIAGWFGLSGGEERH